MRCLFFVLDCKGYKIQLTTMDNATETYVTGRTNAMNHKHQMVYNLRLSYKQMMLYLKKKKKQNKALFQTWALTLWYLYRNIFNSSFQRPGLSPVRRGRGEVLEAVLMLCHELK